MACKINLSFENGDKMPIIGLGTWRAPDNEVEAGLDAALSAGYRHIDCAPVYLNEPAIGRVLKKWLKSGKLNRSDLFIVTKLPIYGNRAEDVERCLKKSLTDLQLDYIDLYLIHVPIAIPFTDGDWKRDDTGSLVLSDTDHVATWKEFERFQAAGIIKHIGVSNFSINQIQRLLDNSIVKPEVNQVEMHLYLQQKEMVEFCKKNKIIVTAYSPLGSKGIEKLLNNSGSENRKLPDLMANQTVVDIASTHRKTPAQVLLRFLVQMDVSLIPKSTNVSRLKDNINIFDFELTTDEMNQLIALNENIRYIDLTFLKGVENHPEYPFEIKKSTK